MSTNMLRQYITDTHGKRIAMVVATGPNEIGWSLCHRNDQFDRKKGAVIAESRARNVCQ